MLALKRMLNLPAHTLPHMMITLQRVQRSRWMFQKLKESLPAECQTV
jgi:hypothetical protein